MIDRFYSAEVTEAIAKERAERDRLKELLLRVEKELFIIDESTGVAGWHLNGDVATWDESYFPALRDEIREALKGENDE